MEIRRALTILCVGLLFGCAGTHPSGHLGPSEEAVGYYKEGVSLSKEGRSEEALSLLKKAVRIYPDYGDAYYNMGILYLGQGQLQEAAEAYTRAIEINPGDAAAHMNLGNIYMRQGRLSAAIHELEEAVKLDPAYGLAHHNLALAYYLARMYHRAWDHLDRLERLGIPPDPSLRDAVAGALHPGGGGPGDKE
ncbi:MAG: tetratricopeptide repeat protein [Deltaproteobacteria bacterium]|nr:tetratricopeptide repeat protein [Deltaproteobacteria bacterium]MBW2123053.1 tetratricopeptide repeat protein [Deltaproteobacteria bacterium]